MSIVAFGGGLGHDSACGGVFLLEGHEIDGRLELLGEGDAFGLAADDQVAAAARGGDGFGFYKEGEGFYWGDCRVMEGLFGGLFGGLFEVLGEGVGFVGLVVGGEFLQGLFSMCLGRVIANFALCDGGIFRGALIRWV